MFSWLRRFFYGFAEWNRDEKLAGSTSASCIFCYNLDDHYPATSLGKLKSWAIHQSANITLI